MECEICGRKDTECKIRKINGMTLCPKHITQYYRNNGFLENTIYDENKYILDSENNLYKIELKNKKCEIIGYAIIDIDDFEKCKKYKWHISHEYVVASLPNNNKIFLHKLITNCPNGFIVDHINHNKLDNRKSNLRLSNKSYNGANRNKKDVGVRMVPSGKYQVMIMKDYKHYYLGTFDIKEEAIKAREKAYKELFNNGNIPLQ